MTRAPATTAPAPLDPADVADDSGAALALAPIEPLAVDAAGAARLIGVSRSMFLKLAAAGHIGPAGVRLGRCVRYSLAELKAWAAAGMPPRHLWATRRNPPDRP